MRAVLHDVRFGLRVWRTRPAIATLIVLTLALGIGVNIVVFGLVEALLLRPLPNVVDTDRVLVTGRNPFSHAAYRAFTERQRSFERTAAWQGITASLLVEGAAQAAETLFVTADYFPVLGIAPSRGRLLTRADQERPEALAAVISDRCWRGRFGGENDIVGRTANLGGMPVTIVGVTPSGFDGTALDSPVDVFVPVTGFDAVRGTVGPRAWLPQPALRWLQMIGRLRDGVTPTAARAETDRLLREIAREIPAYHDTTSDMSVLSEAAFPAVVRAGAKRTFATLLAVAGCVLLVACGNVANLLLALWDRRRGEWAVRGSLGATRGRLAIQSLTETLLLVAVSTVAALTAARWALSALSAVRLTGAAPISLAGVLDARVVIGAVLAAAVTTMACGAAPAWRGSAPDLHWLVGRGSSAASGGRRRVTVRDVLVAVQVAASALLVVGAILFVASLRNQEALPVGFTTGGVAMVRVNVRLAGLSRTSGEAFYARLLERAARLPGVLSVSRALSAPLGTTEYQRRIGRPEEPDTRQVANTVVAPGYFRLLGVGILDGQDFSARAESGSVIVNEVLARQLWPGQRAVGQVVEARDNGSPLSRVVAVVRDSKYHSLGESVTPFIYTHTADDYDATQVVFARTSGDAEALLPALRQAVRDTDPRVPVLSLTTLDAQVASSLAQPRVAATLVAVLAAVAAGLAAAGLYGVLSAIVAARRKETAIRLALGAAPWRIAAALVGRPAAAVAAGLAAGELLALPLGRLVSNDLYAASSSQPSILLLAAAVTCAVTALAAAGPALRAVTADAAQNLRE